MVFKESMASTLNIDQQRSAMVSLAETARSIVQESTGPEETESAINAEFIDKYCLPEIGKLFAGIQEYVVYGSTATYLQGKELANAGKAVPESLQQLPSDVDICLFRETGFEQIEQRINNFQKHFTIVRKGHLQSGSRYIECRYSATLPSGKTVVINLEIVLSNKQDPIVPYAEHNPLIELTPGVRLRTLSIPNLEKQYTNNLESEQKYAAYVVSVARAIEEHAQELHIVLQEYKKNPDIDLPEKLQADLEVLDMSVENLSEFIVLWQNYNTEVSQHNIPEALHTIDRMASLLGKKTKLAKRQRQVQTLRDLSSF